MKCKIYIPSYNRANELLTIKHIPNATHVVRKSQEEDYRNAGVKNILAVEDELIDSWVKVMNYIISDATPEECVIVCDDDIQKFFYFGRFMYQQEDPELIEDELCRIMQMIVDLDLGFGALRFNQRTMDFTEEFLFTGTLGSVYFFNKSKVKGKFDPNVPTVADADFELQELLHNRICLLPRYFGTLAGFNKGKNTQMRTNAKVMSSLDNMQKKWGKYYSIDWQKMKTKINVDRRIKR